MRSLGTAVGAGVLFLLVAACANPQSSVDAGSGSGEPQLSISSSPAPTTTSTDPGVAVGEPPPNGGVAVPAEKIDAAALPEQYPRQVWTESEGSVIGVIGQEGGCSKVTAEVAEQSPTTVRLVLVETMPSTQQMCTMDIRFPPLTAKLDAPLGDRTVALATRQQQ
ncbi:hypothetical protein [Umezawaea tangerina]|uniref:Uncharacterized protein n=1 Tax=Umezawaea tangerina TaxID=84725 RepID=A0A2T0SA55_9PSEU|nr:hypothetical protein [Umezawaea tangerina]PRY30305.1 hypothetical protein CLV43_12437 [Umezawaea tangerina]